MDSLTQITLGAAVGEAVAGRKIGNRAMLWGAIAGTIPDLDVIIGNIFMDDLHALAFHRGITHSLFFAFTFSLVLALIVQRLYHSGYYQKLFHKRISFIAAFLTMAGMASLLILIPYLIAQKLSFWTIVIGLLLLSFFSFRLYKNYLNKSPLEDVNMSVKEWYFFFLLTIVTHPILDCFTTYGTQLFQPFSDYRVSWNNISVFDPFYTGPFLAFLMSAAFFSKNRKVRSYLNWVGLLISSAYMLWTFYNKSIVNTIFENTLEAKNINYNRLLTTPTIANNFLWNCIAETDSAYYMGFYSILEKKDTLKNLSKIPINEHLIRGHEKDLSVQTLKWFSDNYHVYHLFPDGSIQVSDVRYGSFTGNAEDPESFIFKFILKENQDGVFVMEEERGGPPRNSEGWIRDFYLRVIGKYEEE